jgi:hypothetical protein
MECQAPRLEDERRVKRLLEELFPGLQVCSYDDNSRPGMYDLELRWSDGRIEAMEVTSAAGEEVSAIRAAARDLRQPRFMVKAVKVRYRWSIALAPQQHFKQVRPQLAELGRHLDDRLAEREAEPTFGLLRDQMAYQSETVEALQALGVVTAIALPADPDPGIFLLPPQPPEPDEFEPTPPNLLNDVIEIAANAKDNVNKLGQSGRSERHLWVWVYEFHPAWQVFDSATLLDDTWSLLPQAVPVLPPEVTTAWAATEKHATVVWQVRPPEPWQELFRGAREPNEDLLSDRDGDGQ